MVIVTLSFVWLLMDEQGVEPVIAMAARNKEEFLILELEPTNYVFSYLISRNVNSYFYGGQTSK